MGKIKKVLAMDELPIRRITPNAMWTDLCENVHLHYRNFRFDFSEVEFSVFRSAMNHLGKAVEYCANEYKYEEGDPNFLVQQEFHHYLENNSKYYPNRFTIELQRDDTVHIHYRDLRIHFELDEFKKIAKLFAKSIEQLECRNFPYKDAKKPTRAWIDIHLIQPYDEGHRPMVFDEDHRKGIECVKGLIGEGKIIRPILVSTEGQRLDGFKRYMAHWEMGLKKIECIIDPYGQMGGQHNQSFIDD